MSIVTLGLVQMSCDEPVAANLEIAVTLVKQAATRGAQIICLPELFATRYFCQAEDTENLSLIHI